MKRILFGLTFALILSNASGVTAQVSISASSIPQVGDTLELRSDKLPDKLVFERTGSGLFWNFKTLSAPYIFQVVIQPVNFGKYGSEFSNADGFINNTF